MNSTHLEGAVRTLAEERGYAFRSGPESDMTHAVGSYPAAWLAPLELREIDGRKHGRIVYDLTLHLMHPGARLSPARRREALAETERQALDIFTALSDDERVIAVTELSLRPRIFALTPHGEIAQTATARIVTWF